MATNLKPENARLLISAMAIVAAWDNGACLQNARNNVGIEDWSTAAWRLRREHKIGRKKSGALVRLAMREFERAAKL